VNKIFSLGIWLSVVAVSYLFLVSLAFSGSQSEEEAVIIRKVSREQTDKMTYEQEGYGENISFWTSPEQGLFIAGINQAVRDALIKAGYEKSKPGCSIYIKVEDENHVLITRMPGGPDIYVRTTNGGRTNESIAEEVVKFVKCL